MEQYRTKTKGTTLSFQKGPVRMERGQYPQPKKNILRTENISCTVLPSPIASGWRPIERVNDQGVDGFRVFQIPAIRSTTNECSASSRRRIVHGQIESP